MTGVSAEWMALNLSLAMFSPQPSKMHTRTGFLFLEILSCGFRALSMAMMEGSAHQSFSWSWYPRALTDRGVAIFFKVVSSADCCANATSFEDMLKQVATMALPEP